jgi:hypothetical protein
MGCQECFKNINELSNPNFNWEIIVGSLIVVIGWFVSHYFSQKRDASNKRKEIVLDFLIKSYSILANEVSNRDLDTVEKKFKFESLIADLQLFGSLKQVELAKKIAIEMREIGNGELDNLINDLRKNLRDELNLEKVYGNVEYIRYPNK